MAQATPTAAKEVRGIIVYNIRAILRDVLLLQSSGLSPLRIYSFCAHIEMSPPPPPPLEGPLSPEARCAHLAGMLETASSALFDDRRQMVNTLVSCVALWCCCCVSWTG